MLKETFYDSLKISKFTRNCTENNSDVTGWQELPLQSLLLRYTAENYLILKCFQFLKQNLSKANSLRVYRKLIS